MATAAATTDPDGVVLATILVHLSAADFLATGIAEAIAAPTSCRLEALETLALDMEVSTVVATSVADSMAVAGDSTEAEASMAVVDTSSSFSMKK